MRFHRFDGEGTLTVQLQKEAGAPDRTIELLAGHTNGPNKWANQFKVENYPTTDEWAAMSASDRRRHARGGVTKVTFRFGQKDRSQTVTLPVAVGRPIPDGADITGAQLTRTMVGGKPKASIAVSFRIPKASKRTEGSKACVHTGWRSMADGSIRTAVVSGVKAPPTELVDHGFVNWNGTWAEVVIPPHVRETFTKADEIQVLRTNKFNQAKRLLAEYLSTTGQTLTIPGRGGTQAKVTETLIDKWRSPRKLGSLVNRWRNGALPWLSGADAVVLLEDLEAWRHQDRHLWTWQANQSKRVRGYRTDMWRKVAAWIAADAAMVMVDSWSMPALRTKAPAGSEDTIQAEKARRIANIASPGDLRSRVRQVAEGVGATVAEPDRTPSLVHHGCNGQLDQDNRHKSHMLKCDRRHQLVDQDWNTLLHLAEASPA